MLLFYALATYIFHTPGGVHLANSHGTKKILVPYPSPITPMGVGKVYQLRIKKSETNTRYTFKK